MKTYEPYAKGYFDGYAVGWKMYDKLWGHERDAVQKERDEARQLVRLLISVIRDERGLDRYGPGPACDDPRCGRAPCVRYRALPKWLRREIEK